jgi:hypothetical protein
MLKERTKNQRVETLTILTKMIKRTVVAAVRQMRQVFNLMI